MPILPAEREVADRTDELGFGRWSCCALRPGDAPPADGAGDDAEWLPATVPGTVAGALNAAGRWNCDDPTDLDDRDWWFRTTFAASPGNDRPCRLYFDGLATAAEVWLNGRLLLSTDNMFRSYQVDVSAGLQAENELLLGFRSLTEDLRRKRPRPRWKTNLVKNQQLRWHRTSLLGRIPGWSPSAPTIGPWRDVRRVQGSILLDELRIVPALDGTTGVVSLAARVTAADKPAGATLRVGDVEMALEWLPDGDGWKSAGTLHVPEAPLWWPYTHGRPALSACDFTIEGEGEIVRAACSPVGFRKLEVRTDDGFALLVNDRPIYCRGACWTVGDLLSPDGDESSLRRDLTLARDAGANLLRVGGTMTYESEAFYRLCDELGLLVWQDFMFANMDYPVDDGAFRENIVREAIEQVGRLSRHPSVAVYCGNSEIEQQAAMLGLPRDRWSNDWFERELPELSRADHPGTAYVPSTPTGGALPFHTHTGIAHYYGIGAYLRPPGELRQADVKFTPECLGFANVPEPSTIHAVTGGARPVTHDPAWKRRVPRDGGAGWDFEDVRDHYLRETYGVDPAALRSSDTPRYLELSRAVSGEMMARAFSEWRSTRSNNRGGLVWFYKDLLPGAGWGVVDSTGLPKAAYYYLKRSWGSRQLTLTDEGLNGLELHLTNETGESCDGTVELLLLKEPNIVVARQETAIGLAVRSQRRLGADEMLGRFCDVTYAYRFGPPSHDVVVATWFDASRRVVSEAFHFVRRQVHVRTPAQIIAAAARRTGDGAYRVTIEADRFLHTVRLEADGYLPDDNYFHLAPQRTKTVEFRARGDAGLPFRPVMQALNADCDATIAVSPDNP